MSEQEGKGKRWRYGTLGVKEYYIYDPQGELDPPLQGFALEGKRLEAMGTLPSGSIYSPLLGAELRQVGAYLRVIDLETGQPLLTPDETRVHLRDETRARLAVEERLSNERRARLAAEESAASMGETLRRALERLGEQAPPA